MIKIYDEVYVYELPATCFLKWRNCSERQQCNKISKIVNQTFVVQSLGYRCKIAINSLQLFQEQISRQTCMYTNGSWNNLWWNSFFIRSAISSFQLNWLLHYVHQFFWKYSENNSCKSFQISWENVLQSFWAIFNVYHSDFITKLLLVLLYIGS